MTATLSDERKVHALPAAAAEIRSRDREAADALAELADLLASRDIASQLRQLEAIIGPIIAFDSVSVMLHDPGQNLMRAYAVGTALPTSFRSGNTYALDECPQGTVWQTQQPVMIGDTQQDTRFAHSGRLYRESGLCSYWVLPLTTARKALGALAFGSKRAHAFDDCDPQQLRRVARILAVAVESAVHAARSAELQQQAQRRRDELAALLDITNTLVAARDMEDVLRRVSACLHRVIQHDAAGLGLIDPVTGAHQVMALDAQYSGQAVERFLNLPPADSVHNTIVETRAPFVRARLDAAEFPDDRSVAMAVDRGFVSVCSVPIESQGRLVGALNMARRRHEAFTPDDIALIGMIGAQLVLAIENAQAHDELRALKDRLTEENRYLNEEIRTVHNFQEIIGNSPALGQVLDQVGIVAATDSTVLIEGETGTGKELIARAIHDRSPRRKHPLVKVNCAAIPAGLIESELFGHEKGAFTGAIAQRKGRFELAQGGTIFLDEIGDLPSEMQVKLLRALQEREIERVGGSKTITLDVRVIAATNADLMQKVAEGAFRADLYYRLNVFPLRLPPLRERCGDIALLVNWFTQKISRGMRKRIESVPEQAMRALEAYAWPGNIRELENVIERAVILSQGAVLEVPIAALQAEPVANEADALEAVEREHMLRVLTECRWVISGPHGAARRLGLKRTTLQSRMARLGIERPQR